MRPKSIRRCTKCVIDETVPGVTFDDAGVCNHCHEYFKLIMQLKPEDDTKFDRILEPLYIEKSIMGLSGGVDSSYLIHWLVKNNIKPLVVTVDGGWDTDMAKNNVANLVSKLNLNHMEIKLDYDVVNDIQLSFIKAGVIDIDNADDVAIKEVLYREANIRNIKYIISGSDFKTEGKQPRGWSFIDGTYVRSVHKKYGTIPLGDFPMITIWKQALYHFSGIKVIKPLEYMAYNPYLAKDFLAKEYGWQDYGGKHYENHYTKFVAAYWCYNKFGADKRKIEYSAQILSGLMTREEAIEKLAVAPKFSRKELLYIIDNLGISIEEFEKYYNGDNHTFAEFTTSYPIRKMFSSITKRLKRL